MSTHRHTEFVDGCYRCELSRDEMTEPIGQCGEFHPLGGRCSFDAGHPGNHGVELWTVGGVYVRTRFWGSDYRPVQRIEADWQEATDTEPAGWRWKA